MEPVTGWWPMVRSLAGRLPTRARTALAAGLTALVVAAGGAWWLRQHLYDSRLAASRSQALYQARAIARDNAAERGTATTSHADTMALPYVVLDPKGVPVLQGMPLVGQILVGERLLPAPRDALPGWKVMREVRLAEQLGEKRNRLSGRAFPAVGVYGYVGTPDPRRGAAGFEAGAGKYTVYVLVTPFEAEDTVAAIDPALCAGVPAAAFLIAALAWVATRSALRPIEAMRAELAEIGEQRLDRRVPVPLAKDEIFRMAVTTNDTLDRLQYSAEQQRRFVADASHELRSPIAALRTNLEVSLAHPHRTDWPRATGEALEAVRRLQQLADDLLFLACPSGGQAVVPVDLAELAQDLVTEIRYTHTGGAELAVQAPEPAVADGNALQLRRLLRNLLDNAVRHTRTVVMVTVISSASTVRVEIHNDGSDVPAADRERIFERFTRLDESRSRDAGGSGLGLAIARDIAVRHGGVLAVADTLPGTGATFVVELPAAAISRGRPA
ncbi:ATP-binding protein [Streptomyces olivoreticuli]